MSISYGIRKLAMVSLLLVVVIGCVRWTWMSNSILLWLLKYERNMQVHKMEKISSTSAAAAATTTNCQINYVGISLGTMCWSMYMVIHRIAMKYCIKNHNQILIIIQTDAKLNSSQITNHNRSQLFHWFYLNLNAHILNAL